MTPYDAQKIRLRKIINESFPANYAYQIEIDSVDGFQGKEKDLILFSAVRSNFKGEVGFLEDARRMNVMLTRARRGIIIIGDQYTLCCESANWRPWLQYIEAQRSLIPHSLLKNYLDGSGATLLEETTMRLNMCASSGGSVSGSGTGSSLHAGLKNSLLPNSLSFMHQGFENQWHDHENSISSFDYNSRQSGSLKKTITPDASSSNQSKKKDYVLQEEEKFEKSRSKIKTEDVDPNVVDDWEQLVE